jgi:branched-chain amino acid aminotransferase
MTDSRIEMSSDGSAGFSSGPRDDGSLVYIDGELVPVLEARVSVYDHAFLYGDGVFETVHVVDGRAFRLEEHLDRLERSAAAISLHLPGSREEIRHDLLRTVAANRRRTSFVKLIVTRGAGAEPLLRHEGLKSRMVIIDRPSMPFFEGGEELSMSAAIVGTRKTPAASLDPRIKSLNYLNIIQSRIEAQAAGADESILLDADGRHRGLDLQRHRRSRQASDDACRELPPGNHTAYGVGEGHGAWLPNRANIDLSL